jgi:hypothetical protein
MAASKNGNRHRSNLPRMIHAGLPEGHGMSDGNQLAVVLLKSGLAQFPAQDAQALFNHYRGKQLRVRGIVDQITVNSQVSKWIIEVASPDQIDVWPFKKLAK